MGIEDAGNTVFPEVGDQASAEPADVPQEYKGIIRPAVDYDETFTYNAMDHSAGSALANRDDYFII